MAQGEGEGGKNVALATMRVVLSARGGASSTSAAETAPASRVLRRASIERASAWMERVERLRGKNMNEVVVVTVAYGLARMRPRAVMHVARASLRVIQREQERKTMRGDGRSAKVKSIRRHRSHVLPSSILTFFPSRLRSFVFYAKRMRHTVPMITSNRPNDE